MKKILILALLFMGCDYAPTEHEHSHEHIGSCIVSQRTPYPDLIQYHSCVDGLNHEDCLDRFNPEVNPESSMPADMEYHYWEFEMTCERACNETELECNILAN